MKRTRAIAVGLVALIILVGTSLVGEAEAEVVFRASLRAPGISVQIGNAPPGYYVYGSGFLPVRRVRACRIVRLDRDIALRLAWYTGVASGELIQLRARGYTWFEIGYWLRLPQTVIRAAMAKQSWKRFARGRPAGHGPHGRGPHGAVIRID